MRFLRAGVAIGAASALLVLPGIAGASADANTRTGTPSDNAAGAKKQAGAVRENVDFTERSDARLAGSFPGDGARPDVSFYSRIRKPDESAYARGATTTMVETRVEVGGLPVTASRDLDAMTLTTGAGGGTITAPRKRALTALCRKFEGSFGALGTPLPQKKDLLLRTTCYYAEAPVGYQPDPVTLKGPSAVYIQDTPRGPTPESHEKSTAGADTRATTASAASGTRTSAECVRAVMAGSSAKAAACQRSGEDGIVELPDCSPHRNTLYWDAKNPRMCYGNRGHKATGPCSNGCKGRCGAGCGNTKNGYYTRDCAEHDDCSRRTNASGGRFDENCGDEFAEATDDFLRRYRRTCSSCRR